MFKKKTKVRVSQKQVSKLSNVSRFGTVTTTTATSRVIVSEAVHFKLSDKKGEKHHFDGVLMLNTINGIAVIVDDRGNPKVRTNMYDIKNDIATSLDDAKKGGKEEALIKAILLKHIYVHYASLFIKLSPEDYEKVC